MMPWLSMCLTLYTCTGSLRDFSLSPPIPPLIAIALNPISVATSLPATASHTSLSPDKPLEARSFNNTKSHANTTLIHLDGYPNLPFFRRVVEGTFLKLVDASGPSRPLDPFKLLHDLQRLAELIIQSGPPDRSIRHFQIWQYGGAKVQFTNVSGVRVATAGLIVKTIHSLEGEFGIAQLTGEVEEFGVVVARFVFDLLQAA